MKITPELRQNLQDAELLWNTAHRISGHTMSGYSNEAKQRMHALRKEMLLQSMAILSRLSQDAPPGRDEPSGQPAAPRQTPGDRQPPALKSRAGKGATASGTTTMAGAGDTDRPIKQE